MFTAKGQLEKISIIYQFFRAKTALSGKWDGLAKGYIRISVSKPKITLGVTKWIGLKGSVVSLETSRFIDKLGA
jgi:hypothetical protein